MTRPAWNTAPIRCGKMKCKWRGYEDGLVSIPHKRIKSLGLTAQVCPICECDSYMFMTDREIVAWKRAGGQVREASDSSPVGAKEQS